MEMKDFWNFTGSMRRLPFIGWTVASLVTAYLLLRAALFHSSGAWHFPDGWQFLDPLGVLVSEGQPLRYAVTIHALLTFGLMLLGIRRARDAGWRTWIGALMALPVVRLFLFTALAVVPSERHTHALDLPPSTLLGRCIPRSRRGSAVAAILLAVLLVLPLGFVDVRYLEQYGLALFIGLPFLLGSVSAYLFNYHDRRTLSSSLGVAALSVTFTLLTMLFLALEGILCLVMAAPIAYVIATAGALVGHALSQDLHGHGPAMVLLMTLSPLMMAFEAVGSARDPLFKVITSVTVNAPAQAVWNELVAFSRMDEPDELLFRAGISYPVEARIEGFGVGACRYCQFNTGPFVEPITVWKEPELLAFDVLDDPPPLTELSFHEHIEAPHVEGYFRSKRGQFKLTALPDGQVLLEGTTWYTHDIWPAWYWRLWSDAILHRIHERVLEHIKAQAETRSAAMEQNG